VRLHDAATVIGLTRHQSKRGQRNRYQLAALSIRDVIDDRIGSMPQSLKPSGNPWSRLELASGDESIETDRPRSVRHPAWRLGAKPGARLIPCYGFASHEPCR
jgi:hypothetical protein